MIQIVDKVSLRQYALSLVAEHYSNQFISKEKIVEIANGFAEYIQGDAELPEFDATCNEPHKIGFTLINPDLGCGEYDEDNDEIGMN